MIETREQLRQASLRERAHAYVAKKVRSGAIVRPVECQDCGVIPPKRVIVRNGRVQLVSAIELHHVRGYEESEWGNVIGLCHGCHVRADALLIAERAA